MTGAYKTSLLIDNLRKLPEIEYAYIRMSDSSKSRLFRIVEEFSDFDMLEEIFKAQKKLDENILKQPKLRYKPESKDIAMAIAAEAFEAAMEMGFKWWKAGQPLDKDKGFKESVDILHFLVSYILSLGYSAEDLFESYFEKNKTNHQRAESNY